MKKKHPEHVNLERWLVSYADFITLLFAFFVIMYAMAQSDKAKFAKAATSIRSAFGGQGPVGMLDMGSNAGGHSLNQFDNQEPQGGRVMDLPAGRTNTAAETDPGLKEVKELLEESVSLDLGATDASDQLKLEFDSRGLVVRMVVKDFFGPGEVVPEADLIPLLDRIGSIVSKTDRLLRIEGHADSDESHPRNFASDWELSAARAAWVAKNWIRRFEMNPNKIGISGYGQNRPVSSGEDPISRAKNRRVEVIILNNRYHVN